MKKLKCYYAHTMLSYGSTQEEADVRLLEELGFEVINPNCPEIQEAVKEYMLKNGRDKVMEFFHDIIIDCDILAFRPLPDGKILSGIASEVSFAINWDIHVIELPCSLKQRMLDYTATKEFLNEIGYYKFE